MKEVVYSFIKERWALLIVLIVFVAFKIPHLDYPFYWDESWPYASAVKQMYQRGISLSPIALDGEISRGHPLFFHAAAATWMKIFGSSRIAMHSFPLFIAACALVSVYEAGLRLFNRRVAILAVLMLAVQVIFFVQASFVLLEILLGLLAFLSIYFYVRERHFLVILFLSMLFYTKESGLVVGLVLGIDALISLLRRDVNLKTKLLKLISLGTPLVLIVVFFLLQKHYKGWYVLPLYNDLVELKWELIYHKFKSCALVFFNDDYRQYIYLFVSALSVLAAIRSRNLKYLILPVPGVVIYIILQHPTTGNEKWMFAAAVAGYLAAVTGLVDLYRWSAPARQFLYLCGGFVMAFWIFTCFNLFIPRYLIIALIPLLFLTSIAITVMARITFPHLYAVSVLVVLMVAGLAFRDSNTNADIEFGAFDAMKVHQGVVDFMEQSGFQNRKIATTGYLERMQLTDPNTGYLSGKPFKDVEWEIDSKTELVIFDNIEPDYRYESIKNDSDFKLTKRIEERGTWAEIYQRK